MTLRILSLVFALNLLVVGCAQKPKDSQSTPTTPPTTEAKSSVENGSSNLGTIIPRGIDYSTAPKVVAFGSCANQDEPQPLWNVIGQHNPELFVYIGDTIYSVRPEQKPPSEQYKKLSNIPEYKNFREKVPVMAIWDDNDYGQRDGGADNPEKQEYRREFLKHFPYVKDSIGWNQGGLYHAKYIGGNTITTGRRRRKIVRKEPLLQVIVLDTRYYRSPLKKAENPTSPLHMYDSWDINDKDKTVLGEEQWAWFEEQLKKPADLRFIISGIQVIADAHKFEKWGNFPAERQRFFDLLKKTKARNAIIISGDRHIGTIAKTDIPGFGPLFDITASSINRANNLEETDPSYLGPIINKENFTLAKIDWKAKRVRFEIRDLQDKVVNSLEFKF